MNEDWRLLGEGVIVQSVQRLAKQHGINVALPDERTMYGLSIPQFIDLMNKFEQVLRQLFYEFGVTWNDVYQNSDVGKERLMLVNQMDVGTDDTVLDVGCGRGFFTIAVARKAKLATGLDLMNGFGRKGWWQRFKLTMQKLQLSDRVAGAKGNAATMPFRDETFDIASSVHAIRNFQDTTVIQSAFKEMKRVAKKGGRVIVVETLASTNNKAQEAHIKMFNCKVKYSKGDLSYFTEEELIDLLEDVGLRVTKTKKIDSNLSAAPPYFLFNPASVPEEQRAEAVREYDEAVDTIRKYGETAPPTLIAEAGVE